MVIFINLVDSGTKSVMKNCPHQAFKTRSCPQEGTTSPAAFTRATVVVAVKYSIVERPEKIDAVLYPEISSFLMLIKDQDRGKLPGGKEIAVKRLSSLSGQDSMVQGKVKKLHWKGEFSLIYFRLCKEIIN
ncbi:unnamed protein product [Lactuca saligna]|uniref:Uncharacterized protein n=1 Tax=Lactuca saligna TaxID=75948 RepID=A0AA35ZDN5_LACSI|nr:unnamed protein product [Lactuca saligna]